MENNIHEDCGVALVRLLKPLSYYQKKYGTWKYGLNKLYLMMEKEHNRGQEGAGIASVKLHSKPGHEYMFRERAEGANAITEIFGSAHGQIRQVMKEEEIDTDAYDELPFAGELYMGHLRYSTTGKSGVKYVHPFLRRNNWRAKNLCICGNFNMTNVDEVFESLTVQGQCPRIYSDTYIALELMGHRLDREVERNFQMAKKQGLTGTDITDYIDAHVRMENVLKKTMGKFDGGYVMCGITGSGEMFAMRDPNGIRPAYYYKDDEIVVLASERPVLQTTFDLEYEDIEENMNDYADYFKEIGLRLETGNGYFYLSRMGENKQAIENKLESFAKWLDYLDFLKCYNQSFTAGYQFRKSNLIEQISLDIELKEKAGHLFKKYGVGSNLEIVNKLLQEMGNMGFAECVSEQDETYKVTSAFRYAEELVNMIQIANEDEVPE